MLIFLNFEGVFVISMCMTILVKNKTTDNMGRKKIDFTKEQDDRIKQLVNEGYSLNQILPIINREFNSSFSRSGIDRRIKTLGIERTTYKKVKEDIIIHNPKLSNRVEELREWKRQQADNRDIITEQYIANAMCIGVKTLNKMYKQFDIPQRLWSYSRPDIYFDVKEVVDCTTLNKDAREAIYGEILKRKPKDMRVERDVVIRTDPMTRKYSYRRDDDKWVEKTVDMVGVDLKVDFYFPDYKTGFYYDNTHYFKSLCKKDIRSGVSSQWSQYLRKFKNGVKLMSVLPIKTLEDRYVDIEFMAKSMIGRAMSGEYNHWKYAESLK